MIVRLEIALERSYRNAAFLKQYLIFTSSGAGESFLRAVAICDSLEMEQQIHKARLEFRMAVSRIGCPDITFGLEESNERAPCCCAGRKNEKEAEHGD